MSKLNTLTVLLLFVCAVTSAQDQWRYLPNIGYDNDTNYRVEDIYFTDTGTGFAVTLTNRIFKTIDGGVHWNYKNDTSRYTAYRAIEFLADKQTGLAGELSINKRLWLTTDTGETWTDISLKIQDTTTNGNKQICGIGHWANTFYAVGAWLTQTAKLFKSQDKGNTWQTYYFDTNQVTSLVDVHFVSQDTGFVSGKRQLKATSSLQTSVILKTTDGGNNWQTVFEDTVFGGYVWKLQFLTKDYAFGAIQNTRLRDSIVMIRSIDGGNNWSIISVGNWSSLNNPNGSANRVGTQACGFATPAKGWVGGYYEGIFETLDSGKTWKYNQFGYDFNRIFVIDSSHVFAGGNKPYKYGTGFSTSVKNPNGITVRPHDLYPVAPNPISGRVPIKFNLSNETNVVIEIVHIDSKCVYSLVNTYLPKGEHSYEWDGTNAPAGNYFIWLGNNEAPITQKFVLLR